MRLRSDLRSSLIIASVKDCGVRSGNAIWVPVCSDPDGFGATCSPLYRHCERLRVAMRAVGHKGLLRAGAGIRGTGVCSSSPWSAPPASGNVTCSCFATALHAGAAVVPAQVARAGTAAAGLCRAGPVPGGTGPTAGRPAVLPASAWLSLWQVCVQEVCLSVFAARQVGPNGRALVKPGHNSSRIAGPAPGAVSRLSVPDEPTIQSVRGR